MHVLVYLALPKPMTSAIEGASEAQKTFEKLLPSIGRAGTNCDLLATCGALLMKDKNGLSFQNIEFSKRAPLKQKKTLLSSTGRFRKFLAGLNVCPANGCRVH